MTSILLFYTIDKISIPSNSAQSSLLFTSSPTLVISCLIDDSYSNKYEALALVVIELSFLA